VRTNHCRRRRLLLLLLLLLLLHRLLFIDEEEDDGEEEEEEEEEEGDDDDSGSFAPNHRGTAVVLPWTCVVAFLFASPAFPVSPQHSSVGLFLPSMP